MDRRSWLWRRKSSEKSPGGETESSGSISSHSERFSDDQALSNYNAQSPEVTSKAAPSGEEINETAKTLSAKLSEALVNIREKEDLVKQHAKVAEEAVSGWEKAEDEVLTLKRQVETTNQRNSVLEERISHLDGALKECLRQLRQAREENEQFVQEALAKTSYEWESRNSELESKLVELQSELQTSKAEASIVQDLQGKLEYVEKENSVLKLELASRSKDLKLMMYERDLSTSAAETASKQHLESIKKLTKFESECRRLNAIVRKRVPANDHKSNTASSVYVESFTDSFSDSGERLFVIENDSCKISCLEQNHYEQNNSSLSSALSTELNQYKHEKPHTENIMAPSAEINLMDDFLEMEKLAAFPDTLAESALNQGAHTSVTIVSRTTELEEKLRKMEEENLKLKIAITECRGELKILKEQKEETEESLMEVKAQLAMANEARKKLEVEFQTTLTKLRKSTEHLQEAEADLMELKNEIFVANEARKMTEAEVESAYVKLKTLTDSLEEAQVDVVEFQTHLAKANEAKRAAEEEVEATTLELKESEKCLEETEFKLLEIQTQLETANEVKSRVEAELEATNAKKDVVESQLKATELEVHTLLSRVNSLQEELRREKALSQETDMKLQKLKIEISSMRSAPQLQKATIVGGFKINKDKEMARAAGKYAECQKTIASIGLQLKSLATMKDFPIDSEEPLQIY